MSNKNFSAETFKSLFASLVIVISLIVSILIFKFVMGNPSNFEGGDITKHPIQGNLWGIIYKGGFIVPILMTVNLLVIVFSIERFITIRKASGKGRVEAFIRSTRELIANDKIEDAISACDVQKGSVANVIKSGLTKYKMIEHEPSMDKEGKLAALQKELEESTTLELPMLSKNLVILSTCATIATLLGLIGTVLGMIRSFAAMANAGSPDTVALATGISEALINTAFGIIGSCVAIIMYNFFTTKIDALTYGIDEAGFSIVQTFAAKHKN